MSEQMPDEVIIEFDSIPEPEAHPRHCVFVKPDGSRCRAYRLVDSDLCPVHGGSAAQNLDPVRGQQRSAQVRKERSRIRKMTPLQRLEEQAAIHEQQLVKRLIDIALAAQDDKASLSAISQIFNRIYGKPEQRIETVGTSLDAAADLSSGDLAALMAEVDAALKQDEGA